MQLKLRRQPDGLDVYLPLEFEVEIPEKLQVVFEPDELVAYDFRGLVRIFFIFEYGPYITLPADPAGVGVLFEQAMKDLFGTVWARDIVPHYDTEESTAEISFGELDHIQEQILTDVALRLRA